MLPEIEHLFRHHYGRLVAALTRVFGPSQLDLVEDVVQEAMLKAMRSWPYSGVPDDPAAWITRVAHNLALDAVRHRKMADAKSDEIAARCERFTAADPAAAEEVADDTLRMIFTCCHPALPPEARLALTLKTLCGFGTREIASALLTKEATVAQRLTRAKARLQREGVAFEVPGTSELAARLESVLEVVYLVFNEGYRAHRGADLVRPDLVAEAVRLASQLTRIREVPQPAVHALLAHMLLLGARIPARTDAHGELLTLAEQDRSLWDADWLRAGFAHFDQAIGGDLLTTFHIEASIASIHAMADTYESTDWGRILARYDDLLALTGSPVARLNRVVAVAKVRGIGAARGELAALSDEPALREYPLLPVTRAHFAWLDDDRDEAARAYADALRLPMTRPERALVERRATACAAGAPPPSF